jgi:Malate synthase G, alpha-beta insertion domain
MDTKTALLDLMVPLAGASHADAIDYAIVIPLRYAECAAILADGRQVRLREARQLVGWSGPAARRTFVFRNGDRGFEIRLDAARRRRVREVRSFLLAIERSLEFGAERVRKLIACDGSLVYVREVSHATSRTTSTITNDRRTGDRRLLRPIPFGAGGPATVS